MTNFAATGSLRNSARRAIAAMVFTPFLVGCAVTPAAFYRDPSRYSEVQICRASEGKAAQSDSAFRNSLGSELSRRGKSLSDCREIIERANTEAAIATAAILGAAILLHEANKSGGYSSGYAPSTDYSYAWDQFYHSNGSLVWACRGRQTGRFSELSNCQYLYKNDNTWPGK